MSLGSFVRGGALAAADLEDLAQRVRRLQGRGGAGVAGGAARATRVRVPGRAFGFELAELNGLVWVRQGWVAAGNGRLYAVGEEEWNVVGRLEEMTVWLEMGEAEGRVVATEYDVTTPERSLRRRLGYVRREVGADGEAPVWHAVQVCGGLMVPAAPRRMAGGNTWATPVVQAKGDAGVAWLTAGNLRGVDFEKVPGRWYAGRSVGLPYMVRMGQLMLPPAAGGGQLAQFLDFGAAVNLP